MGISSSVREHCYNETPFFWKWNRGMGLTCWNRLLPAEIVILQFLEYLPSLIGFEHLRVAGCAAFCPENEGSNITGNFHRVTLSNLVLHSAKFISFNLEVMFPAYKTI
ncbi:Uncharacterised protein [Salmonella bongori]|nr:Uncharacterised protein [Salmonella bongori]